MPTVRANGLETYYERYGDGPPLVVVHGALSDHRVLAEQLRPLSDGHELVVYDVRGHGHTGGSDRATYSMELFADDLAALVERLALDRPAVFGHSMGGMIVQAYGSRYPETPRALVTAGAYTPNSRDPRDRFYLRVYAPIMYRLTSLVGRDRVLAVANRVDDLLVDADDVGDRIAEIRAAHDPSVPDVETAEFHKVSRAILDFLAGRVALDRVAAPTLLLYGEDEPSMAARHAALVAAAVTDGRTRMVADAGHTVHVDRPGAVVSALESFLE